MSLSAVLGAFAGLSVALILWQWFAGVRFPLHTRDQNPAFAPPVTILKPLKGCDAETETCLASWLDQQYRAPVQILFGVASADDPASDIVRRVIASRPGIRAELMICPERLGPNGKVSTLAQLTRHAAHELLVVSDADVRVPPDFLAQTVPQLADPGVGLVNCFYQLANPSTAAMRWEAIAVNADFWSQVLQAQSLKPLDFALGAVMLMRRSDVKSIGGFESLVDYLADDYQLGNRIAKLRLGVALSPIVVECRSHPMNWREAWHHQLRWARTIRVCQPAPFFFSILNNVTVWSTLWFASAPNPINGIMVGAALILRVTSALHLEARLTRKRPAPGDALVVLLKDVLGFLVWALAFVGNTVEWRGVRYRVLRGGKLVSVAPKS